jgi:hypothetical protein
MRIALLTIVALLMAGCSSPAPPPVDPQTLAELTAWVDEHGKPPVAYVTGKFADHDVVVLGEEHRFKHDLELVADLIPAVHEAGVYVLATEFARREDQPLIDSLLGAPQYDDALAQRITFLQYVHWGFREYVDIFRHAWELNRSLPDDARPFRILGMNCSPDYSYFKEQGDQEIDSLRRLARAGCREDLWAAVILEQVSQGEKALVHCGFHHAFTEYLQPIVSGDGRFIRFEEDRVGRALYEALGKRVITIHLHSPWEGAGGYGDDEVQPADGIIDLVMANLGDRARPLGFDIVGGPFADLKIENAVYRIGYDNFALGTICDGWIWQMPFTEYEVVSYIDGFINESNLDYARAQAPNPRFRDASVEDFENSTRRTLTRTRELVRGLGR